MTKTVLQFLCLVKVLTIFNEGLVSGYFCENDSDCVSSYRKYCCRARSVLLKKRCRANCIGQYCTHHDDCARNECCGVLNRCTTYGCPSECRLNLDCKSGTYCCRKEDITAKSVCLPNCVGEFCRSDTDCGGRLECCSLLNHCTTHGCQHECMSNKDCSNETVCCVKGHVFDKNSCKDTCLGESCKSDQDCGGRGHCCGSRYMCTDKCNLKAKMLSGWIIATIAVSVCCAILFIVLLVVFCARRSREVRKPSVKSLVVEQPPFVKGREKVTKSKHRSTHRRPPPLPPSQLLNFSVSTEKTPIQKRSLDIQPSLPRNISYSYKTLIKVRRKPPSPPAAKPDILVRQTLNTTRDVQRSARLPSVTRSKDQAVGNLDLIFREKRRRTPLPPARKNRRQPPPVPL